jgi:hypothetical protein
LVTVVVLADSTLLPLRVDGSNGTDSTVALAFLVLWKTKFASPKKINIKKADPKLIPKIKGSLVLCAGEAGWDAVLDSVDWFESG